MPNELSVEERLEKARILTRVPPDVLNMAKTVDQLLHAQHMSNLAQAVVCVQELARDHYAVVIALKWVVLLVDMLESDTQDVRLASCNAIAAVSMVQEGRDVVRSSGGLRPLVMLLSEGSRSPVAAAAASALMNCSACDTCKEAIADCRGVPQLLGLIREAVGRVIPGGGAGGPNGGGRDASGPGVNDRSAGQDLRSLGDCKAAAFAAGALMNMGGVISVQEKLLAAGAVPLFEQLLRIAPPGDVVATRANFMLSWLAVASGTTASASERRGHLQHRNRGGGGGGGGGQDDASSVASAASSGGVQQQQQQPQQQQPSAATPQSSAAAAPPPQPQQQPQQPQQQPQSSQQLRASPSTAGKPAAGRSRAGAGAGAGAGSSKPGTPVSAGKGAAVRA